MKNFTISKSSRCCTYTPFLPPRGRNRPFSIYRQRFPRYRPISKIAIFGHETLQVANVKELAHILSFYCRNVEIEFYGQPFLRYRPVFKIAIFIHEIWSPTKDAEVANIFFFYPIGSKMSLFLIYGQRFPRYGPIFTIAIFGYETWQLAKIPEVARI